MSISNKFYELLHIEEAKAVQEAEARGNLVATSTFAGRTYEDPVLVHLRKELLNGKDGKNLHLVLEWGPMGYRQVKKGALDTETMEALRAKLGLSMTEVASAFALPRERYNRMRNGTEPFQVPRLFILADLFGVAPEILIRRDLFPGVEIAFESEQYRKKGDFLIWKTRKL